MVSNRQKRIAKKKYNIGVRRKQLERLSRQEKETIARKIAARERRTYVNYASDLPHMEKSLGIDIAAEIKKLGCKTVLDLGCGNATALSQLETIPGINFFGLNFTQESEFSRLKRAKVKIGKTEELSKHFEPKSMDFVYWNYGAPHSLDLLRDLQQICAVLRFGGRLVFNVGPNQCQSKEEMLKIKEKIKKAGFEAIREINTIYKGQEQFVWNREPRIAEVPSKAFYLKKTRW